MKLGSCTGQCKAINLQITHFCVFWVSFKRGIRIGENVLDLDNDIINKYGLNKDNQGKHQWSLYHKWQCSFNIAV